MNCQLPLKAQPKEMVQLVSRECIEAFAPQDSEGLDSALDYANDPNTRTWSTSRLDRLQALAGWRLLGWDSQVLGCRSGSIEGLWAEGDYAEQRRRLEIVLNACIADAEDHGVRFLSVRLPEDAIAALHAVKSDWVLYPYGFFGRSL